MPSQVKSKWKTPLKWSRVLLKKCSKVKLEEISLLSVKISHYFGWAFGPFIVHHVSNWSSNPNIKRTSIWSGTKDGWKLLGTFQETVVASHQLIDTFGKGKNPETDHWNSRNRYRNFRIKKKPQKVKIPTYNFLYLLTNHQQWFHIGLDWMKMKLKTTTAWKE